MPKYRQRLPQLANHVFLTDSGLETELIFHDGMELPCFASFILLENEDGTTRLRNYYQRFATTARNGGFGLVLESPTWRANADWAGKIGYSKAALADANRKAIALMAEVRDKNETPRSPMVISGNLGPRGDGYNPSKMMSAIEAETYHAEQIDLFRGTEADMVSAFTMNYVDEAIGIAHAAKAASMPVVISFTVETDGKLPTGQTLKDAINQVDAETGSAPAYFMLNCAHPTHFAGTLKAGEPWVKRLRGLRANASRRSHAELDVAPDLDDGDPVELGRQYADLRRKLGHINVLGGCCGTDHRHIEQIAFACVAAKAA
jgi:S-methylmethionine-dependent homocysteine/selenocysteine methylase